MDQNFFAFIVIVLVFNRRVVSENETFCQMYANNNYRIDFSYQHSAQDEDHFFLVVNTKYWELKINPNSILNAVKFRSINQSLGNEDLKKEFNAVFQSAHTQSNGRIETGFLSKNVSLLSPTKDSTIKWKTFKYEPQSGQLETEADGTTTDIFAESRLPIAVAFKGRDPNNVCLMYQMKILWANWTQNYHCYNFANTESGKNWINKTSDEMTALKQRFEKLKNDPNEDIKADDIDYTSEETAMNYIRDKQQVIAIFRQNFSGDIAYVFIYNQNKELVFCVKDHGLYNGPCKNDDITFADCSNYHPPTPPTLPPWTGTYPVDDGPIPELPEGPEEFPQLPDNSMSSPSPNPSGNSSGNPSANNNKPEGSTNKSSWTTVFIVLILIIIIIIVIAIVFWFAIRSKKTTEKPEKQLEPVGPPVQSDGSVGQEAETKPPTSNGSQPLASDNETEYSVKSVRSSDIE